jgi:hypothetical protein
MLCGYSSPVVNISKKLLQQYERLRRHCEGMSYSEKWQMNMLKIAIGAGGLSG